MKDLAGQRFGRWLVLSRTFESVAGSVKWLCRCDCGTEKVVNGAVLRAGRSTSCGCYRIERGREHGASINLQHGDARGHTATPEYRVWNAMTQRCTNPNWPEFQNYGGRGICVCARWLHSFENFLADMGRRPGGRRGARPEFSLDRRDNDGPYSPENCRWATWEEQNQNKRKDRPTDAVSKQTLVMRLRHGWPEDIARSTPPVIK